MLPETSREDAKFLRVQKTVPGTLKGKMGNGVFYGWGMEAQRE